jgi:hypothetical protein
VAKYWRRWARPALDLRCSNNKDLNQVTWARVIEGNPKFDASQPIPIPDVAYHPFADLIGFKGIQAEDPDRIGPAWEDALAADRPAVLEFNTDPDVPPLPPHITLKRAKAFTAAVIKGRLRGRRRDGRYGPRAACLGVARKRLRAVKTGSTMDAAELPKNYTALCTPSALVICRFRRLALPLRLAG